MCPSQENNLNSVALDAYGKPLRKTKTYKIRMDAVDDLKLNDICKSLGYSERATVIRYLIHHYSDIEKSKLIVDLHNRMLKSIKEFETIVPKEG